MAALVHVGIINGGPNWYRYFGAGERMASAAAAGRIYPTVVTTAIATALMMCSAYALSGSGVTRPLPGLRPMLVAITGVYLLRGLLLLPLLTIARSKATPFLVYSSVICLGYGGIHLLGLIQVWRRI